MEQLIRKYRFLLSKTQVEFTRFLFNKISRNAAAWMIMGGRGTGKTTLLLQFIKSELDPGKSLYVSLDDLYFREFSLYQTAETFFHGGGEHLALDEVHKYPGWQQEIKNIIDFLPGLRLYISGSSVLELKKAEADLSRRVLFYDLPELSFREFLLLHHKMAFDALSLDRIISQHASISEEYAAKLNKPLAYFNEYLKVGAYPFYQNDPEDYLLRIQQLVKMVIDYDLPEATQITVGTQNQVKKLLQIISQSVPFIPNISKIAEDLGTSRTRLIEMLHYLEAANLTRNLWSATKGISLLNKPEKIYLHNTSLMYALGQTNPDIGNIRETALLTWVSNAGLSITYSKKGDFLVNENITLEIGGRNKGAKQITGQADAYIVADDLPVGFGNKIPLWLWGFLY
jgi:predicted AAA+ superfamily ATPase